jgi:putative SOS response-associated peptidase YedK
MCGRFTLTKKINDIRERFKLDNENIVIDSYNVSYNIAPSQKVLVIYNDGKKDILEKHQWGLVPHWAKDIKIGYKMINARVETVAEKPSYKKSFYYNRCLIIADGYYEWIKAENKKIPYYFQINDHDLFAFAGIRAIWEKGNEIIKSCSIITAPANSITKPVHDRMPVILRSDFESIWINKDLQDKNKLLKILQDNYNDHLSFYQVSMKVNSPKNNYPELIGI